VVAIVRRGEEGGKGVNLYYLSNNPPYYLLRPWEFVHDLGRDIKAFIQRGSRGWADCDVWNLNDYLRKILAGGLRRLAKEGISYPGIGEMDTLEKWRSALRSNAKKLENVDYYEEDIYREKDKDGKLRENVYRDEKEALKFVVKWFDHLWD
jgi:hypothetical protein